MGTGCWVASSGAAAVFVMDRTASLPFWVVTVTVDSIELWVTKTVTVGVCVPVKAVGAEVDNGACEIGPSVAVGVLGGALVSWTAFSGVDGVSGVRGGVSDPSGLRKGVNGGVRKPSGDLTGVESREVGRRSGVNGLRGSSEGSALTEGCLAATQLPPSITGISIVSAGSGLRLKPCDSPTIMGEVPIMA
jgi:hypothetical protein